MPIPEHPPQFERPTTFRATVHGTVFGERSRHVDVLQRGDPVVVLPDPPGMTDPGVWVHLPTGEPIGHLPPEIARWLWPWLVRGGNAVGRALAVHGSEVPSWRRLVVEVECRGARSEA